MVRAHCNSVETKAPLKISIIAVWSSSWQVEMNSKRSAPVWAPVSFVPASPSISAASATEKCSSPGFNQPATADGEPDDAAPASSDAASTCSPPSAASSAASCSCCSPSCGVWGVAAAGGMRAAVSTATRASFTRSRPSDGSFTLQTAQHSTAQHSTAQHSTAQHSTAQHSTAQHSTAQHSTAQHSTAQ
jgi:hypothetical protein